MQDEVDIELTVELDKESASTSETKIRWFIDDIEIIEADNRFKMVSESSYIFKLIIRKADEFRTVGRYKCVATNRFGSSETSAKFDVHSPPKFIESLTDKEVESPGNDVTLRVRVTGSPRPDVKWFKDGRQIYADSRVKLSVEELSSTYSLTIHDVNENDLGTYTVEAFNIVGRETSTGVLTGGGGFLKPSFRKGLSDIFVNQDATDVELMVEMNPPKARTEVKWMFNDIEISPDDDRFYFKSDESRGIYRLFIKKADKLSVGLFKCVASNEHGKTRTSGRVSLKRAPDFEVHIPERKPIEREPFNFTSESHYTPGPDTMLLQHRDPEYPLRVREYLRVGAMMSPFLANKLRESHWGDADIGYGFSPQVAVRERRRFNDVQKEIEKEVVNNEPYTRGRRFYKNTYIPKSRPTTPIGTTGSNPGRA